MTIPNTLASYFGATLRVICLITVFATGFRRHKSAQSVDKIPPKEEGYLFAVVLRMTG